MTMLALILTTLFHDAQVLSCVAGISVWYYNFMEGIFMIWDKLRYGIRIFWIPD